MHWSTSNLSNLTFQEILAHSKLHLYFSTKLYAHEIATPHTLKILKTARSKKPENETH